MKTQRWAPTKGFTLIEILVVIVVIGILTALGTVVYGGVRKSAAETAAQSDLHSGATIVEDYMIYNNTAPSVEYLQSQFKSTPGITLTLVSGNTTQPIYSGLSAVQNAVLFDKTCRDVMEAMRTTPIRSHDNSQTNSTYLLWCGRENDSGTINKDGYRINGWDSTFWTAPVTLDSINGRIANPATHSYWNTAAVDQQFYTSLRDTFLASGGTFPITTFWDTWMTPSMCTVWWCGGVLEEPLPELPTVGESTEERTYCIQAQSDDYDDVIFSLSSSSRAPLKQPC